MGQGERSGSRPDKDNQQERPAQGRDKNQEDDDHDEDDESGDHEFQKATEAMCVDGGASLHISHRQLKQWAREITAVEPSVDARKPLRWSNTPIIFVTEEHPDRTTAVGCLPLRDLTTPVPTRRSRQTPPARRLPGAPPAGPWRLPPSQGAPASNSKILRT